MNTLRLFAVVLACAAAASAQSRVTIGANVLHDEEYIDLDTGTVLSKARFETARAEWKLATTAEGQLQLAPCEGATIAAWDGRLGADGPEPDPATFKGEPVMVDRQISLAGRTSEGRPCKVLVTPVWPASAAQLAPLFSLGGPRELQVEFAVAPGAEWPAPAAKDVRAVFAKGRGLVTWSGQGKWRVDWFQAGAEKAEGSMVVEKGCGELKGLEEGKVYRVEIRPLGDSGVEGEPRAVPLFAGECSFLDFDFKMEASLTTGGLDLEHGCASATDANFHFDGRFLRTVSPGGAQWLGEEKSVFDDPGPLPEFGYRTLVLASEKGGVYAVRLHDGRYAKVWFDREPGSRDWTVKVRGRVLAGGGLRLNLPPEGLRGTFDAKGHVRLTWSPSKDAARYVVLRCDGDARVELGGIDGCEFVDTNPPKFSGPEYRVSWIDADGILSAPAFATVDTWPPGFAHGSGRIRCVASSFDFRTFTVRDGGGEADFSFASARDRKGIPLSCDGGIAKDVPGEFGRFDWKEAKSFKRSHPETEIHIPDHLKEPFVVRLLTRDGGYAHVRFEPGDRNDEYDLDVTWVLLAVTGPPDLETMEQELLPRVPADADEKTCAELVAKLGADSVEERDAAQKALEKAGLKAVRALILAARTTKDTELRARATRILEKIWDESERDALVPDVDKLAPDVDKIASELLSKAPKPTDAEAKDIDEMIANLGGFKERADAAEKNLQMVGLKAVRALVEAARKTREAEVRTRTTRILQKIWAETR
ncbi:MAG: hypothetical protein FD180_3381 [Planctomycetota bacterium]|nr:MAG: hypothetical protein FD180_3381 [Planctomycetota bacterium]